MNNIVKEFDDEFAFEYKMRVRTEEGDTIYYNIEADDYYGAREATREFFASDYPNKTILNVVMVDRKSLWH